MTGNISWRRPISVCARLSFFAWLLLLACGAGSARADDPTLRIDGNWIQGALLQGHTAPGTRVTFLGNEVQVTPDGSFILGLGRDAPSQVELQLTDRDGHTSRHTYRVQQRQYDIQRVDGVEQRYVAPSEEDQRRIDKDNRDLARARALRDWRSDFRNGFVWPLVGPITGVYGSQRIFNGVPKQPHFGLDIAAPIGTLVRAPAAGQVTLARDLYYSGWTLLIDHGQGLSSAFLHLNQILVKEGQRVEQGDVIAEVGSTGRVTGPHLDWRMNWLDQRLDVELLLPPAAPEPATP